MRDNSNSCITNDVPSTAYPQHNVYHMHVPLFVLDVVRLFQDHPKFSKGLKETHIVEMFKKQPFACGDLEAQVKMALSELQNCGFVRHFPQGYRTLGPFAKLATARHKRQFDGAWNNICDLHRVSSTNLHSTCTR